MLDQLLSANNYSVQGVLPEDEKDRETGTISFSVASEILPVLDAGAALPDVKCIVVEKRRQSNITPYVSALEQSP